MMKEFLVIRDIQGKKYCYAEFEIENSKKEEHKQLVNNYNNSGNDLYITQNFGSLSDDFRKMKKDTNEVLEKLGFTWENIVCPFIGTLKAV